MVSETRATCASGTFLPAPVLTGSSPRPSSEPRSASGARTTTSTRRSASRYWPICTPLTAAASERETPAEVTPSARARSWSTSTRMASTLSPQSALTSRVAGCARTAPPPGRRFFSVAVVADDAELDRVVHRRAERHAHHRAAHPRKPLERLARRADQALRAQPGLASTTVCEVGAEQVLLQRQEKRGDRCRHSSQNGHVLVLGEHRLELRRGALRRAHRRAGQPQLDQQLDAVREEELLFGEAPAAPSTVPASVPASTVLRLAMHHSTRPRSRL